MITTIVKTTERMIFFIIKNLAGGNNCKKELKAFPCGRKNKRPVADTPVFFMHQKLIHTGSFQKKSLECKMILQLNDLVNPSLF